MQFFKTWLFVSVALISVLVFTGCASGGSERPTEDDSCDFGDSSDSSPDELIPLSEGNRWVAEAEDAEDLDSLTAEVVGDSVNVKSFTNTGSLAFFIEIDLRLSKQSDGILVASAGLSNVMLLKFPVEGGTSYEHTDANGNTWQVTASRTSVAVPAGDFDTCLEDAIQSASTGELRATLTVKPGLGPVRWSSEEVFASGGTVELVSTSTPCR